MDEELGKLNPCIHRKGTSTGNGLDSRMILVCNGFETTIPECRVCNGLPKTKMTLVQTLNQKWNELKTTLKRRIEMEELTHDQIVEKLELANVEQPMNISAKTAIVVTALLILLIYGILSGIRL